MNLYFCFILFFLGGVYLIDTLADVLNFTRLNEKLPLEFEGIYDPTKYSECLNYQREHVRFDLIQRTVSLISTLIFIIWGGFNWVDQVARGFDWGTLATGLVFVGTLLGLRFMVQLPFSIYDTFVLEEKYGFNKTTFKTFCSDLIKGVLLGGILGGLIFSGIVYFFEKSGPNGWIYAWATFTLLQLIIMYLAPALIMPLFNEFSPLPESPLRTAIETYARSRNFQLNGIFTMDSSKRSTKSNAFFTGFGKFRRLVLFDTLISKQTEQELVAILAHEIGHFEKNHILKSLLLSIGSTGIVFFTFHLFINNRELFDAFKMAHLSVYASIVFIGFLYSPVLKVLSIFTQKLSRRYEFEADAFAAETYGKPEMLISALKKLSMDNLSHLTPHPLKVALDSSHPPVLERIRTLKKYQ